MRLAEFIDGAQHAGHRAQAFNGGSGEDAGRKVARFGLVAGVEKDEVRHPRSIEAIHQRGRVQRHPGQRLYVLPGPVVRQD